MLAILTSKTGLIGMALALVLGVIFVQTARLNHAKHDLADAKASLATAQVSLRSSESSRTAEYAQAKTAVSDAETACAARVAGALRSGSAIRRIVEKPPHVDPITHCPLRELVPAGELRDAVQPNP